MEIIYELRLSQIRFACLMSMTEVCFWSVCYSLLLDQLVLPNGRLSSKMKDRYIVIIAPCCITLIIILVGSIIICLSIDPFASVHVGIELPLKYGYRNY